MGDPVDLDRGVVHRIRDRALYEGLGGTMFAVCSEADFNYPSFEDVKTMLVIYVGKDQRQRNFASAAELATSSEYHDCTLPGPRTAQWLVLAISRTGFSPSARHWWWRQIMQCSIVDEGVDEHHTLCEMLENFGCFDQLNIGESMGIELVCRRIQMWEYVYQDRLQRAQHGSGSVAEIEERSLCGSGGTSRAMSLVCPSLLDHIKEKLADRNSIRKEQRKARENQGEEDTRSKARRPRGGPKAGAKPPFAEAKAEAKK